MPRRELIRNVNTTAPTRTIVKVIRSGTGTTTSRLKIKDLLHAEIAPEALLVTMRPDIQRKVY